MSAKPQPDAIPPDLTDDAVLGGRLRLWQPRRGHRFGHDAILLAAATPASVRAVDLGAGVGAAGLALAARVPGLRVTLVDISADLAALAALNAARNQLAGRVDAVALDVAASPADYAGAGLPPGGVLTVIFRADGLVDLIGALAGRFGAIAVLPVHGKPGAHAIRIIAGA